MSIHGGTRALTMVAVSGMLAGLAACGGSEPAPVAPASTADPAAVPEKNGCKGEPGEKHACNAEHKDGDWKTEATAKPDAPKPPAPR